MISDELKSWREIYSPNEGEYISRLILEMREFFKQVNNFDKGFDLNLSTASKETTADIGLALEIANELKLVYFLNDKLKLSLTGYELANIGKKDKLINIIDGEVGVSKPGSYVPDNNIC